MGGKIALPAVPLEYVVHKVARYQHAQIVSQDFVEHVRFGLSVAAALEITFKLTNERNYEHRTNCI